MLQVQLTNKFCALRSNIVQARLVHKGCSPPNFPSCAAFFTFYVIKKATFRFFCVRLNKKSFHLTPFIFLNWKPVGLSAIILPTFSIFKALGEFSSQKYLVNFCIRNFAVVRSAFRCNPSRQINHFSQIILIAS